MTAGDTPEARGEHGGHDVWGVDFGQVGWHQPEAAAPVAAVLDRARTAPAVPVGASPEPVAAEPSTAITDAPEAAVSGPQATIPRGRIVRSASFVQKAAYDRAAARAEAAEAKLADIAGQCRGAIDANGGQRVTPVSAAYILGLAESGSDEGVAIARQLLAQAKAADAEYKVAAVRAAVYTFLHQYGRSALPAFKVAIDLAVSLRKIIDDLGSEEEARDG